ncbi:hypothetical protein K438DRAFT_1771205 [Mycena galopus ATCC 62051]|nr:hypothetical protein K438DRAFT_1771205 [Mycena galopus ATCC 62051]
MPFKNAETATLKNKEGSTKTFLLGWKLFTDSTTFRPRLSIPAANIWVKIQRNISSLIYRKTTAQLLQKKVYAHITALAAELRTLIPNNPACVGNPEFSGFLGNPGFPLELSLIRHGAAHQTTKNSQENKIEASLGPVAMVATSTDGSSPDD